LVLHEKNNFFEIFNNLVRYSFENNFVKLSNNYKKLKLIATMLQLFAVLFIMLKFLT